MMMSLFAFTFLFGVASCELDGVNYVLDNLLDNVRSELSRNSSDVIPVPDMEESFDFKYVFGRLNSHIHCKGGVLRDLSSVAKASVADVSRVKTSNGNYEVEVGVRLRLTLLRLDFKSCRIQLTKFLRETKTAAFVFPFNSLRLKIKLNVDPETKKCKSRAQRVTLNLGSRVFLFVSSGTLIKSAFGDIAIIVGEYFKTKVRRNVITRLSETIQKYAEEETLCHKIFH